MKILRDYQQESLTRLAKDTSGLDGSDLGTGKTLVGVERIRHIDIAGPAPRVLIVAPINTHRQWKNLLIEQYPGLGAADAVHIISTPSASPEPWRRMLAKQPGAFIIGWEAMRGTLPEDTKKEGSTGSKKNPPVTVRAIAMGIRDGLIPPWTRTGTWDLVIADESHRMANRGSLQKKVLKKIKAHHKLALSATAGGNRPEGLWSTLNWLWPDQYTSFWDWAKEHMVVDVEETPGYTSRAVREIQGEKFPGSTWTTIPCVVRHRRTEVAKELPEVIERVVEVPMGDVQRVQYEEFEDQALAWIDDHPVAAPLPITQRIRLRQAALGTLQVGAPEDDPWGDGILEIDYNARSAQPKLTMIKEIIRDLPREEPVIIFTHSAKWARMAAAELDSSGLYGEARAWTGKLSGKQRENLKQAVISYRERGLMNPHAPDGIRILVAQVNALSEGVDGFQLGCCCEIWASPSEDQIANQQAMGRLHRSGQEHPVQRWILHSEDSIDVDVAATLALRRKRMSQMYRDKEA